jgi:NAD(P)-dependent dehydrogenase (short-subunit alcohol dehydrogenase family)
MIKLLKGKAIVIMGGTTGIGFSAARALIKSGASVLTVGAPDGPAKSPGKNSIVLLADARQEGVAEHAIDRCIQEFGSFDGLYHIAGGSGRKHGDGPVHQVSKSGWEFTIELNLTSLMLSNRAAVNQLLKQKSGGAILNTGSVLSEHPSPEHFSTHAYAASKAAITGLSKAMASSYARKNIRVNVIVPGLTDTPMASRAKKDKAIQNFIELKQPLDGGRMGNPSDLDGLAVFLFSEAARFITGQTIKVDGGWSVTDAFKSK